MRQRRRRPTTAATLSVTSPCLSSFDDEPCEPGRRRVALVTEGTYPGNGGGVSTWCDQIVRALSDVDFQIVAITLTHREPQRWTLPNNARLANLPIWDRALEDTESDQTPVRLGAVWELARVLTSDGSDEKDVERRFARAIDGMIAAAVSGDLAASIDHSILCDAFRDAMTADPYLTQTNRASLRDVSLLAETFSHVLRPLLFDIGAVDVVHTSASGLPVLIALAMQARRHIPFILTEHGLFLRERYLAIEEEVEGPVLKTVMLRFYQLLTRLGYQRAAVIAPVSDFNRRWQLRLGASDDRVRLIHSAVEPGDFAVRIAEPAEASISWLGRIDPIKDLHTLIRAAAVVRDQRPDVKVRIFGSATASAERYLASCRQLIEELSLSENVSFEGWVGHAMDAFSTGQISALSSISEGFPYSVLESMACGVPVVGTDVGGVMEAIGPAGSCVPARDHEAMGAACLELLDSAPLRRRLGVEGRQRVEKMFGLGQMLAAHRDMYDELATMYLAPGADVVRVAVPS